MEKFLKLCVGADVSQVKLDVCLSGLKDDLSVKVIEEKTFSNNAEGISKLMKWAAQKTEGNTFQIVMEATGVYHEKLAFTLSKNGIEAVVVLPKLMSNYFRSHNIRQYNDEICAEHIAMFGLSRKLDIWKEPETVYMALRALCRHRYQLDKLKTQCNNQIHAQKHSETSLQEMIDMSEDMVKLAEKQMKEIDKKLQSILNENDWLKEKVAKVCTVIGLGWITVVKIISETSGFNLIRNSRQLVAYAGYDVLSKESGTSVHTKSKMSKKGNKYIRAAMYMPALSAIRSDPQMAAFYSRLFHRHFIPKKSNVAVQKKLLVLIYTLWKNDCAFDPDYRHPASLSQNQENNQGNDPQCDQETEQPSKIAEKTINKNREAIRRSLHRLDQVRLQGFDETKIKKNPQNEHRQRIE